MQRRSFVHGAGLAGVLAAGVAPAVVHAQANIRWRLTSSFPKSLDTIFGAADTFARKVKITPRKNTKSQFEVWGAPTKTNFGMSGNLPSTRQPARRIMSLAI